MCVCKEIIDWLRHAFLCRGSRHDVVPAALETATISLPAIAQMRNSLSHQQHILIRCWEIESCLRATQIFA